MKKLCRFILLFAFVLSGCKSPVNVASPMNEWEFEDSKKVEITDGSLNINEGQTVTYAGRNSKKGFENFIMGGYIKITPGTTAKLMFHTDKKGKGYEVLFHNGPSDGTLKTGSLTGVRNLYKTMVSDNYLFPFVLTVKGKHISIYINGVEVVSYIEPEKPYRTEEYKNRVLGKGNFTVSCAKGSVMLMDLMVKSYSKNEMPDPALMPVDEQTDSIIRLQQAHFPVIDYHVHLKGWTKEEAHAKSMNYGINYGIAPNCGIGFPITDDAGVAAFMQDNRNMPFFFGMQGEGREWVNTFSLQSRNMFDYVFTDALTFSDHKGRRTRLWINDEVIIDVPQERYMDVIVDRTLMVLNTEPINIFVNPFFLPEAMVKDYDKLWTEARVNQVVDALKKNNIALEINARYRIPNFAIIKAAKAAGVKLTFGTNNGDPNIGKLEYCIEAMEACGITAEDIWFPSHRTIRK